jgi:hypothetical protein
MNVSACCSPLQGLYRTGLLRTPWYMDASDDDESGAESECDAEEASEVEGVAFFVNWCGIAVRHMLVQYSIITCFSSFCFACIFFLL